MEHMLRHKGNMRRGKFETVCQADHFWGGRGEGLVDFRKNIYVYKIDVFLNHTL